MTELKSKVSLLNFGPGLPAVRIGERINPTGKPKMQESIMNGDLSFLAELAREQEAADANALGVNIGMPMRNAFNRAFVAMAVSAGLSAAILNPNSTEIVETVMAADVLANRDPYAMNFLEFFRSIFKPEAI